MWVATQDLPRSASHLFYRRLNQILNQAGFDAFVEGLCARFSSHVGSRRMFLTHQLQSCVPEPSDHQNSLSPRAVRPWEPAFSEDDDQGGSMKPILQSIAAVLAGFVVASVVMMAVETVNGRFLHPELAKLSEGMTDREARLVKKLGLAANEPLFDR